MVGHGRSSAGSYLVDPTSPIPSHCASIVMTSTLTVNVWCSLCRKRSASREDIDYFECQNEMTEDLIHRYYEVERVVGMWLCV